MKTTNSPVSVLLEKLCEADSAGLGSVRAVEPDTFYQQLIHLGPTPLKAIQSNMHQHP